MAILNQIITWIEDGIKSIINLLPDSPFQFSVPPEVANLLGYVNYFIPLGLIVKTLLVWTTAIGVWYAASVFMRWIKAIE